MMIVFLGLIGATLLVVRGGVFASIRRLWPALFGCAQCFGTWVGGAAGATGLLTTGHGRILDAILVGAATGVTSLMTDAVLLNLLGGPSEGT